MSRRNRQGAAEKAAMEASEAGKVLQSQRGKADEAPEPSERTELKRPEPRDPDRENAMNEIVERHHKVNAIEEKEEPKEEPKVEAKEEPKEEPKVEEPKVEEPEAVVEPPKVRVKVDGEESDVLQSEVDEYGGVKAYQIAKSAEKRLEKANQTVAETRQQQAAFMQYMQQFVQQQQPQKPTSDQLIAQKIDVIRYGTPEESAAAMREVLESAVSANKIDPRELEQRIVLRSKIDRAAERFRTEFADVMANPMIAQLAAMEEQKRLNSLTSIPADFYDIYRGIGNELRTLVSPRQSQPPVNEKATTTGNTSPETASTTSQPTSDKEARKSSSNVVSLPTTGSRATAQEEKTLSPEEARLQALNDMKTARGIPTG